MAPPLRKTALAYGASGLWAPGVRLFSRLNFVGKTSLVAAVLLAVVAQLGVHYVRAAQAKVEEADRELRGIALERDLLPVYASAQALRTAAHAAGGTPPQAPLGEAEQLMARAVREMRESGLPLADEEKFLTQSFGPLKTAAADAEEAFTRADEFSQQLQRLFVAVADGSGLSVDSDRVQHHLGLASTQETLQAIAMLARVRDLGAAAIGRKEFSPFERHVVQGDLYALYKNLESLFARYERVAKDDPGLGEALGFQKSFDPVNAFMRGVRKTVLASAGPQGDAAAFAATGEAAVQSLLALTERSQAHLHARVSGYRAKCALERNLQLAFIGACLLVTAYLLYCFYAITYGGIREMRRHLDAMAAGDLSTEPQPWGRDEMAGLVQALQTMQLSLRALIGQVRDSADDIVNASSEVSGGANDLSSRTETAASRLQQTAATMDHLLGTVQDTTRRISESAELGGSTAEAARRSQQVIGRVVQTMQEIDASSRRVGEIVGVIDGIAFQTNILSLNAAVEAARAGEHGRGFAVVAAEVRALAQRSAVAAKEIKTLVADSAQRSEQGTHIVHEAGRTMSELMQGISRISEMLHQVRGVTQQQAHGVVQVSGSIAQLDEDTQRNAALVEQATAAAESMTNKARELNRNAARFVLPAGIHEA